ncbi:MAG: hypothetical protein JSV37_09325 [Anaerolineaceae bacterium]|nr:MAG: hypothetical protein JSV37_09325 [Anaerolineaceae bacterium]
MARKRSSARIRQGQDLARKIYDRKIRELESLSEEEKGKLRREFPLLSQAEFDDVIRQTIEAKRYHQELVGWRAVPHDIAVLILVILTAIFDLRIGIIACIAALVFLESIFQFYFNRDLYRPLSTLVWLTYPAYLVFAYLLYREGFEVLWIAVGVILASIGTYILGGLARIPVRMILENRARGIQEAARIREEREKESGKAKKD